MEDHDRTIRNEGRLNAVEKRLNAVEKAVQDLSTAVNNSVQDLTARVTRLFVGVISILGAVVATIFVRSPWWLELLVFLIVGLGLLVILSLAIFIRRRAFSKGS